MIRRRAPQLPVALLVALLAAALAAGPASSATPVNRVTAAERYAYSLLDCNRGGGFVTIGGRCLGRGSGRYSAERRPLRLHPGISARVAWPWARTMAALGFCGHDYPGRPGLAQRMRQGSFGFGRYGENVGCASGRRPRAAVLAIHLLMQAEQESNGGHWRNLKNPDYKSVGIGVARGLGRVTVVWDFYGKRY